METFVSPKFSNLLTGFWKLLHLIEKKKKIGAIFMDLSKVFDTIDHSFSDSKAKRALFFCSSCRLVKNYFKLSKQRKTKNDH